jgi:hypothetical protein
VLFAGAVQDPDPVRRRLPDAVKRPGGGAARILGVRAAVPLHFEGWTHFTQGADALRAAFAGNGMSDVLVLPERGETVAV